MSNVVSAFLILGGGCTDEAGMENIGNTDRRIPLTISVTVSSYTAIDKKNTSVTRTPIENGYTTEFSDSDAIGIFALRNFETPNVATIDGVYNLKLVYTKAAVGTGSWAPATGDTHALYSYDDNLAYVAYYHIGTALQSNETIKRNHLKRPNLANNAKLQPAADQSTSAAYTGSDLMAAVASPTVDPANANEGAYAEV